MSKEDGQNKQSIVNESSKDEEGTAAAAGINIPDSSKRTDAQSSPLYCRNIPPLIPGVTDASPPRFVSWDEIQKAANGITNMALVHEIAVDDNFRLEKLKPPKDSIHGQVKETVHKAFWDLLREQLSEDPANYSQALVLLEEIKQDLMACLLPKNTKFREQIEEVLDTELIKQQIDNNTLDFQYYANFVITMMSKLCAPIRDEVVRDLSKENDTVNLFRKIMEVLELMILDFANFTITMFRSDIMVKSGEYEKAKFKEFLQLQKENGTDGLEFTREWLLRRYKADVPSTKWFMLIGECFMDLLDWKEEWNYPETVLIDRARFTEIGEDCQRISVCGAIVLMALTASAGALQSDQAFKEKLKNHVHILLKDSKPCKFKDALPNVAEQVVKNTNDAIEEKNLGHLTGEKQSLLYHNISDTANPDQRIRYLISQRLREFLLTVITTDSGKTSSLQVPPGLSTLKQEIAEISGKLLRLVQHNRDVFGEFYYDIYKQKSDDA